MAQTPTTPPKQPCREPLQLSDLTPGRFYLVKLLFPSSVNEESPLQHHITTPGETPVFKVDHLYHGPSKARLWGVDRKKHGKSVYRTCLVVKRLERSAFILIGSTSPSHPRRWLPMEGFQSLPGQPATSVLSYPPGYFAENPKPLFLCYTHVFQVSPVLKHSPALPQWEPGLVHIASMNTREVFCKNLGKIRCEHRSYWLSGLAGGSEGGAGGRAGGGDGGGTGGGAGGGAGSGAGGGAGPGGRGGGAAGGGEKR